MGWEFALLMAEIVQICPDSSRSVRNSWVSVAADPGDCWSVRTTILVTSAPFQCKIEVACRRSYAHTDPTAVRDEPFVLEATVGHASVNTGASAMAEDSRVELPLRQS